MAAPCSRCWRSCASTRSGASRSAARPTACAPRTPTTTRRSCGATPGSCAGGVRPRLLAALGLELANLRAAVRHLVYTDRLDDAADFAWGLLIYWWIMGLFGGVRRVDARAARQGAADPPALPRDRVVLRAVGRDVAAPLSRGRRRPRRVRAAVHRERGRGCRGHGAGRAGDRARAAARPRHRHRRARARRCGRTAAPARQRLGRGDHARLARPGRVAPRRAR